MASAIGQTMMGEVQAIARKVSPHATLLVADAMTGQDAVRSAEEFHRALALTGVILTKLDGDARGGAALSVKAVTGKPIKFVGVGEKLEGTLKPFRPDGMAQRILGFGDVLQLVQDARLGDVPSADRGKAWVARRLDDGRHYIIHVE